jgi:predicted flap endonuclease-1-like 5' DNA nuclease
MLSMIPLQDAGNTIGWVWYLLVVVLALALIIGWIFQQSKKQSKQQSQSQEQEKQNQKVSAKTSSPRSERAEDDLTVIEGIGPKVASVLKDAGITNFDSLSNADPAEVKSVLNEAGLQMMNPEGWIEQAEFAAKEDWDGLEKLQDELKGGRRK